MDNIEQVEDEIMTTTEVEDWQLITKQTIDSLIHSGRDHNLGYLIWTKPDTGKELVQEYIEALQKRSIRHLRTGISWAEWQDQDLREWIKWYIRKYSKHFTVLPCLTFTPPELGIKASVNSPPRDPSDYARFVARVLEELGDSFEDVELWNEWNISTDWLPELDPEFQIFSIMVRDAAETCHKFGKRAVLGGPSKITDITLARLKKFSTSLVNKIDIVGFHNLRGTWSDKIPSPPLSTQAKEIRRAWGKEVPVYFTEYSFAPIDEATNGRYNLELLEDIQVAVCAYAVYATLSGTIERAYWYTYKDLRSPSLRFATTGWEDILQHHFGDTKEDGAPRKLGRLLLEGGPLHVLYYGVEHNLMPLVDKASLDREFPFEKLG
jgi:CDP-paratose 2-epimerase